MLVTMHLKKHKTKKKDKQKQTYIMLGELQAQRTLVNINHINVSDKGIWSIEILTLKSSVNALIQILEK